MSSDIRDTERGHTLWFGSVDGKEWSVNCRILLKM
jgi:hypothetical protein